MKEDEQEEGIGQILQRIYGGLFYPIPSFFCFFENYGDVYAGQLPGVVVTVLRHPKPLTVVSLNDI